MNIKRFLTLLLTVSIMVSGISVTTITAAANYTNQGSDYAVYNGNDLGATYSKDSTTFKVWAPSASKVQLKLYRTGSDFEFGAGTIDTETMTKDNSTGVWSIKYDSDLGGVYYTYAVTVAGTTRETQDVYSYATGVNGDRSMVLDREKTNPKDWENDKHVVYDGNYKKVNIWEVNVRDFSIAETSGVDKEYRGKYLAFTQGGTTIGGGGGESTCLDYLVKQGIRYVHLNPIFDFGTVDETRPDKPQYNWGYDPVNFNVPEGSYSTDPYKGDVRVRELKQMIQALHDRGIGVIMDVVYNHTLSTDSCFERTVPGYYYRMQGTRFMNSSGCGNVMASDKTMVRKYMVDSVMYWANEYHIDGFRFDLMGCHDISTMNEIRSNLDKIDKGILMYGEPWTAIPGDNGISAEAACVSNNSADINERIGMFNDTSRNAFKGRTDDESWGYIQGYNGILQGVKAGMMGGSSTVFGKWARQPSQCVTYNSAHDNLTLWDKILKSGHSGDYNGTDSYFLNQNKLAAAIVLTSQGMPFYLAGEEFARTKYGNQNSYNAPDSVNQIDWGRVKEYKSLVDYYRGLMLIRDCFSPFRDETNDSVKSTYFVDNDGAMGYTIENKTTNASEEWYMMAILTNNSNYDKEITLISKGKLPSNWVIIANGEKAGLEKIADIQGSKIKVPPKSAMVLVDAESFNSKKIVEPKCYTVTTKHIDKNTNTIMKIDHSVYREGTTYRVAPDSDILLNYELNGPLCGPKSGIVKGEETFEYYYVPSSVKSYELKTKFVDEDGKDLKHERTEKLKDGTKYTAAFERVPGYILDTTKLPKNVVGTIGANTTVTYVYKRQTNGPLKVHYYKSNDWSNVYIYAYDDFGDKTENYSGWPGIRMEESGNGEVGWYTSPLIDTNRAKIMLTNGSTEGTLQEPGVYHPGYEVFGEVWINNQTVSYNSKVIVSYIDQNGNKLANDEEIIGERVNTSNIYQTQGLPSQTSNPIIIGDSVGLWGIDTKNVIYVYNTQ